jgi:hypothetical protein
MRRILTLLWLVISALALVGWAYIAVMLLIMWLLGLFGPNDVPHTITFIDGLYTLFVWGLLIGWFLALHRWWLYAHSTVGNSEK